MSFKKTKISQIDRLEEALGVQSATIVGSRIIVQQTDTNLYRFRILDDVANPLLSITGSTEGPIFNHNALTDEMELVTELSVGFHEVFILEGVNIRVPAPDGGSGGNVRLVKLTNNIVIAVQTADVLVGIPTYNPDTDLLMVYEGGKFQTLDVDYFLDTETRTISKPATEFWLVDDIIDIVVLKNIPILDGELLIDGYTIINGSIPIEALAPATISSLRPSKIAGTIPTAGWVAHTANNPLKLDLAIAGITVDHDVTVEIDEEFQGIAQDAEMNTTCKEYNGGITLFAKTAPATPIPVIFKVVKLNG